MLNSVILTPLEISLAIGGYLKLLESRQFYYHFDCFLQCTIVLLLHLLKYLLHEED